MKKKERNNARGRKKEGMLARKTRALRKERKKREKKCEGEEKEGIKKRNARSRGKRKYVL